VVKRRKFFRYAIAAGVIAGSAGLLNFYASQPIRGTEQASPSLGRQEPRSQPPYLSPRPIPIPEAKPPEPTANPAIRLGVFDRTVPHGLELGVQEINDSGGILGRQIQVVGGSSMGVPTTGRDAPGTYAYNFITNNQIDFLVGSISRLALQGISDILDHTNKLMIYNRFWTGRRRDPEVVSKRNVFVTGPDMYQMLHEMIEWAMENFGKRFFLYGHGWRLDGLFHVGYVKKRITELGGTVVGKIATIALANQDTMAQIRTAKTDVLIDLSGPRLQKHFIELLNSSGVKKELKAIISPGISLPLVTDLQAAAKGIYQPTEWVHSLDNPQNKDFLVKYRATYGGNELIDRITVGYYMTPFILKAAAEKAGSLETDKLRQGMEGLTIDGPLGAIWIRPEDHQARLPMRIARWTGWEYELVKELGPTISPDPFYNTV